MGKNRFLSIENHRFSSYDFRREPTKSFYVKHGVVTSDAADRFVEAARLISQGREIGDLAENLVIVNAQKFGTNSSVDWEKLNRKSYNLLIVDEAHHFPAPTWNNIVSYFKCKTIFLTATPFRKGRSILSEQNGKICYQISIDELMSAGVIRKIRFREIGTDRDSGTERKTVIIVHVYSSLLLFHSVLVVIMCRNSSNIE